MGRRVTAFLLVSVFLVAGFVGVRAVVLGQTDTFDSDLQGWHTGVSSPVPTMWESTGGPAGAGDGFMRQPTTGTVGGPGAKLVVMNTTQWAGDYVTAGVESISMDVRNAGATALELRIYVESSAGAVISTSGIALPTASGWQSVSFPIDAASMTIVSGTDYNAIMSSVNRLRLIHGTSTVFPPVDVDALLDVDNVSAGAALPVELVSFGAKQSDGVVELNWTTASETNNLGFDILERTGTSADFAKIGFVTGRGGSVATDYTFSVERRAGDYAYRLRQVDADGSTSLSPVVEVAIGSDVFAIESVYPNPATGQAFVDIVSPNAARAAVTVVDALGREVLTAFDGDLEGTRTVVPLEVGDLASGLYIVRVTSGSRTASQAFSIVR